MNIDVAQEMVYDLVARMDQLTDTQNKLDSEIWDIKDRLRILFKEHSTLKFRRSN